MASSCRAILAVCLVAAVLCPALSARRPSLPVRRSRVPLANGLSYDFHDNSCPNLQDIVWPIVASAVLGESAIAAGLLRIFFHDCFPQGCDASLLLKGANSELDLGPNLTLQPRALQLIEDIRVKVHAACGPTVSCADILTLATRDAVFVAGESEVHYFYDLPLGRNDSFAPAPSSDVFDLPAPTSDADTLIRSFQTRNLQPVDLVALSGAHSIGKAHCSSFSDRSNSPLGDPAFVGQLRANCSRDQNQLQDLDVSTPILFDTRYYRNLLEGKGVFTSDQVLASDPRTQGTVQGLANNKDWFYSQFREGLVKLSQYQPRGNVGEIRRNSCFATNANSAAAGDEGFAASA